MQVRSHFWNPKSRQINNRTCTVGSFGVNDKQKKIQNWLAKYNLMYLKGVLMNKEGGMTF